jgi:hypothetical protein
MKIKKSKTKRRKAVKVPPSLLLLVFTILGALVVVQILTMRGQSQQSAAAKQKQSFPVVDYNASPPTNPQVSSKRLRKNGLYDKQTGLVQKSATGDETLIETEWAGALPALPVYGSDAVVLGEVKDAQAFLSNDKSGVYSEFTVQVEQVFKDDTNASISLGSLVSTARIGGNVRYSRERIQAYHVVGQNMPQPGKRYIFFLRKGSEQGDYLILTAYEIRSGRIYPLDGASASPPQPWAGDAYENTDEGTFLQKLREAISQSPARP